MSTFTSIATGKKYGLKLVCKILKDSRSTVYAVRRRDLEKRAKLKPGPKPGLQDEQLLQKIKDVIATSKFSGEGHRKIRARLKREHKIYVSRKRVLKLMREHRLLSPHRSRQGKAKKHDGRITTDSPNIRECSYNCVIT